MSREHAVGTSRENYPSTSRGIYASTSRVSAAVNSRESDAGTSRGSNASTSRECDSGTSKVSTAGKSRGSDASTSRERDSSISRVSIAGKSRGSDASTSRERDSGTSRGSNENIEEEFCVFKEHLTEVQTLMDSYNTKIIDKTLCEDDLIVMKFNLEYLSKLEQRINGDKMKSIYVPYKVMALKIIQESYRICNWLIQKQFSEMDNVFELHSFFDKIFKACAGKESPVDTINTLFTGVLKNSNNFNLHIYGNIKQNSTREIVLKPAKKEYQKSQKRPLEDQIIPFEVENEMGENELQITMTRVKNCLRRAVSNNDGKPISFIKFAIDPFSFPHTVENLFHLSLLVKDKIVKIGLNTGFENDKFDTITVVKKRQNNNENNKNEKTNYVSSLFKINRDTWKNFIVQYNIEERMIPQDD